jgi:hypothetical protein
MEKNNTTKSAWEDSSRSLCLQSEYSPLSAKKVNFSSKRLTLLWYDKEPSEHATIVIADLSSHAFADFSLGGRRTFP